MSMLRVQGWEMADRIKPLMGVRWEEGLDKPVNVWREELDIEPNRHGQNIWYEVLTGLELWRALLEPGVAPSEPTALCLQPLSPACAAS